MSEGAARVTRSAEETEVLGEALGARLRIGDRIVLIGPLGAGKTRFVKGLARGIGCAARVRSPSFTLIHEYDGPVPLAHLDLYRLETPETETLGIEEILERAALVVEWGDRLPEFWRREALVLNFALVSAGERRLAARARSGRGLELLSAWERSTLPR